MLFIIRSEGNASKNFIEKIYTLFGPGRVEKYTDCGVYELKFILDKTVSQNKVTVIELHEGMAVEVGIEYARMFENKFNLPVFLGRVSDLWQ